MSVLRVHEFFRLTAALTQEEEIVLECYNIATDGLEMAFTWNSRTTRVNRRTISFSSLRVLSESKQENDHWVESDRRSDA
jgi:hypothetical protein